MKIVFSKRVHQDFLWFKKQNSREYKKIKELLFDIEKNNYEGIGKPEPLKNELAGYWSRRITKENRLVYMIKEDNIIILSCRFHYK